MDNNFTEKQNKILDWLKSDAGKAAFDAWVEKNEQDEKRHSDWVERLTPAIQSDPDAFIEKLCAKYYSDEYRDKWYGKGIEPPETLLWYVFAYAEKNCIKCTDQQHLNMFTRDAYYIGSYVIQVMDGQGSVIRIDKCKKTKATKPKFSYFNDLCYFLEDLQVVEAPLPDKYARDGFYHIREKKGKGEDSRTRVYYCDITTNGVITWYHWDYDTLFYKIKGDMLHLRYTPMEVKALSVLYNNDKTRKLLKPDVIELIYLARFSNQLKQQGRECTLALIKEYNHVLNNSVLYEEDLIGLSDDEAGKLIRNSNAVVYKREMTQEEFNEFKKQL